MELKWLEDFLSLAETRSFSRSAEERRVTQPAFSRRIRSLEVWLGTVLLDRSTYPITLTARGPAFSRDRRGGGAGPAPRPRRVPRGRRAAERCRRSRITALHTLCLTFLPQWLTGLRVADRAGGEPGAARQLPHLRPGAGRGRLRLPADLPSPERARSARPRPLSASRHRPRQPRRGGEPGRLVARRPGRGCRCCSIRAARSSACSRRSPRRRKARRRPFSPTPTRTRWPRR